MTRDRNDKTTQGQAYLEAVAAWISNGQGWKHPTGWRIVRDGRRVVAVTPNGRVARHCDLGGVAQTVRWWREEILARRAITLFLAKAEKPSTKGVLKKFKVTGHVVVSAYTLVEATSEAEALRMAADRSGSLCPHSPTTDGADPTSEFIIDGADGSFAEGKIEPFEAQDQEMWNDHRDEADEDDEDA